LTGTTAKDGARPHPREGEQILFEAEGRTNWELIVIYWALLAAMFGLLFLASGLTVTFAGSVLACLVVAGLIGFFGMRRESRNKALLVTSDRVMVRGGSWKRNWSVYDRSRMENVRVEYDGGLEHLAGIAMIEFEIDGVTEMFKLSTRRGDWDGAAEAILGSEAVSA
jgi:hypothetical protein